MTSEILAIETDHIRNAVSKVDHGERIAKCLKGLSRDPLINNFNFSLGCDLLNGHTLVAQSSVSMDPECRELPVIDQDLEVQTKLGGFFMDALALGANMDPDTPEFKSRYTSDQHFCFATENNFLKSLGILPFDPASTPKRDSQRPQRIIIDSQETPIFIQESIGPRTWLSLVDVVIGGRKYPPGTVVKGIFNSFDPTPIRRSDSHVDGTPNHVMCASEVSAIHPGRLTQFAFDTAERPYMFTPRIPGSTGTLDTGCYTSLDMIRARVKELL